MEICLDAVALAMPGTRGVCVPCSCAADAHDIPHPIGDPDDDDGGLVDDDEDDDEDDADEDEEPLQV